MCMISIRIKTVISPFKTSIQGFCQALTTYFKVSTAMQRICPYSNATATTQQGGQQTIISSVVIIT